MIPAGTTQSAPDVGAGTRVGLTAQRRSRFRRGRRVTCSPRRWRRMGLERLEDRTVPATVVWDGGPTGQGTNWLDRVNWVGDVLPGPNDDAVIGPQGTVQGTQVSIASLVNNDLRSYLRGGNYPIAPTTLNVGGVEFDLVPLGSVPNSVGVIQAPPYEPYQPPATTVFTIPVNVTGPSVVYTLMNSKWGVFGENIGTLEFVGANGSRATFTLTEGINIRDHYNYLSNNNIAPGTPSATFGPERLDRQTFLLPRSFASDTLTQVIFTANGAYPTGSPFLAAMTVSTQPVEIILPGNTTVNAANVGRPLRLTGGTLTFATSASFANLVLDGGTLNPLDGGSIVASTITGTGTLTNPPGRSLTVDSGRIDVGFVNQGVLVAGGGATLSSFSNAAGATLRTPGGLTILNGFTNSGAVELTTNNSFNPQLEVATGTLVNAPGGSISMVAGSGLRTLKGRIDNQGTITVGADTTWTNTGPSVNSGTIDVTGGSLIVSISGSGRFATTGTANVAAGRVLSIGGPVGAFTNLANKVLSGGTFNVSGRLIFPVPAPVDWSLAADLVLDGPGARLELPGVMANLSQYLRGIASAGHLTLINGATASSSFTVANAGTLTVGAGSTFSATGGLTNTGTLAGAGTVVANITNSGTVSPDGALTVSGDFGGTGRLEVDLDNAVAGKPTDQLKVIGTVTLGGPLVLNTHYSTVPGDVFRVIDNVGLGPIIGTFAGLPEGIVPSVGDGSFRLSYIGGSGNDVTLTRTAPVLPQVLAVRLNDGTAQRSSITSLAVTFNTVVTFAGPAADAFMLTRDVDASPVAFTATANTTGGITVVKLSPFAGAATEAGSLADGRYTLTVRAGRVSTVAGTLDGNGDGMPGDDYAFGASQGLFRLYGDATGDGWVDAADLLPFRQTFGRVAGDQQYLTGFDVNGDGAINGIDLTRFRQAYLASPPRVSAVQINDGSAQRSRVTSLSVTFGTFVTFAGLPDAAFALTRDDGATVTFAATVSQTGTGTRVTLDQFAGAAVESGSLADGRYTLRVLANQVSTPGGALDGNGDGLLGDDYTFGAGQGLRRLYGDATGDGAVDAADVGSLRQTFGRTTGDPKYLSGLDVNGDGVVNGTDLTRFRQAYLASPPRVSAVQVNDGSAQRSRITSLSVTFSRPVTFAGAPATAFLLTREDGTPVTFVATVTVAGDATRVTLNQFAGPAVEAGSLADGRYTLRVLANQVSTPGGALDGNGDGTSGDDYTFGAAQGFARLYGDANGNGTVDAADLALFRQTFGRMAGDPLYQSGFDVNGDGAINGIDLTRFRQAFGAGG